MLAMLTQHDRGEVDEQLEREKIFERFYVQIRFFFP